MKKLLLVSSLVLSATAFADVSCTFPTRGAGDLAGSTLSIMTGSKTSKYTLVDKSGEMVSKGNVKETIQLSRTDFENDELLQHYMKKIGMDSVENFIYAKFYVTESNVIGKAGLLAFYGGRGVVLKKAFVTTYADVLIKCKK